MRKKIFTYIAAFLLAVIHDQLEEAFVKGEYFLFQMLL